MAKVDSQWSSTLDEPPSCVAFHPARPEVFVVGTYLLHPAPAKIPDDESEYDAHSQDENASQKRSGSLTLNHLDGTKVEHIQTLALESAVLDIEWSPYSQSARDSILCVATSTGSLEFYILDAQTRLKKVWSFQVSDPTTLVLDLVWHPISADTIALTLSTGEVALCKSTASAVPWTADAQVETQIISTHSLEAWTLAFTDDGTRLLSGGDDAVLQCSEVTHPTAAPLWQDRKLHGAGVTAILPLSAGLVLTGSYDDHIRLISTPAIGRRKVLAELDLGGGVWRLKPLWKGSIFLANGERATSTTRESIADGTDRQDGHVAGRDHDESITILASCMHAGARVVQLTRLGGRKAEEDQRHVKEEGVDEDWRFEVLAAFEEHASMNYGSDVQPMREAVGGTHATVVSTSFYDRLMCVWKYDRERLR